MPLQSILEKNIRRCVVKFLVPSLVSYDLSSTVMALAAVTLVINVQILENSIKWISC